MWQSFVFVEWRNRNVLYSKCCLNAPSIDKLKERILKKRILQCTDAPWWNGMRGPTSWWAAQQFLGQFIRQLHSNIHVKTLLRPDYNISVLFSWKSQNFYVIWEHCWKNNIEYFLLFCLIIFWNLTIIEETSLMSGRSNVRPSKLILFLFGLMSYFCVPFLCFRSWTAGSRQ